MVKEFLIMSMFFLGFSFHVNAATQTRTENGYTLIYENRDTRVPQSTFQRYVDLFFKAYPGQCAKYNPSCPKQLSLFTSATLTGPAAVNSANTITVNGNYAIDKPDDINLIAHESMHSVQGYPDANPLWITEGIASYAGLEFATGVMDFGNYDPLGHYTEPYGAAPRFLVYLEQRFPGIVKTIDSIMRNNQQGNGQFWLNLTGETVDQLWDDYVRANEVCPTGGDGVTTWNNAARSFALQLINEKRSQIASGTFVMSNGAVAPPAKNMNKLSWSCSYEAAVQKYFSTCNSSYLPGGRTFDAVIGLPTMTINESLNLGVPSLFGFSVTNQNGNAMLIQGTGAGDFAYDSAKAFACGFTTSSCFPNIKAALYCVIGPNLPSSSSPVYAVGSKCSANSHCTKADSPICDVQSGLCVGAPTSAPPTTTKAPTTTTTTTPAPATAPPMAGCSAVGNGVTTWNNAARGFALQLINEKRSQIANGTFVMSNGAVAPAAKNMNKLTYSCEYEAAIQSFFNTCNGNNLPVGTFGFSLGFPWLVNSINESLSIGVPYYFGFTVANQNGNAMVTQGSAQFAYDNAKAIGCGFTQTPCSSGIKTELFCAVGPILPSSSPVYAVGNKCSANSQCTKADSPICDVQSGLCVGTSTPPATTTPPPKLTTLTFYDEVNFNGESKAWNGSGNACDNFLSDNFNDRADSVNTGNGCVMLYEHRDCQGQSVKLQPACGVQQGCCPAHSSLAVDCNNFVNRASSHRLC